MLAVADESGKRGGPWGNSLDGIEATIDDGRDRGQLRDTLLLSATGRIGWHQIALNAVELRK